MLISLNRFIALSVLVFLLLCFCCEAYSAPVATSEGGQEAQKALIGKAKDSNKQGKEVIEVEDTDGGDDEDVRENAASVEVNQSVSPEESFAPLLSREYLSKFDIPIVFNDAVDYFIRYFTVQKRKVFVTWLKRAKRYAPMIREILREQGLPEDLVYLAMIESGFNPKAYSPMKACGPWQFIYETGERYGLKVSYWVDERRDPQKSTVAAARYLKDLFNQFGCWYLAAAGYNAGENRVERAIVKHETNDFWELSKYNTLPRETREYIPQLIAAAVIAKDPARFGLTNIPFEAPIPSAKHSVPGGTPLALVAKAARFDLLTIHSLNPEVLRGITPPGAEAYPFRLPQTVNRADFQARLKAELQDGGRVSGVTVHTVKRKDSISKITKRYGISHGDLMLVNACGGTLNVEPGSIVYIPRFERDRERKMVSQESKPEESEKKPNAVPSTVAGEVDGKKGHNIMGNRVFHVVRKGENLADISEKYGTDVAILKRINRLKKDRIVPNMRLEVAGRGKAQQVAGKIDQARADGSRKSQARTLQARPARLYHVVKKGENLTEISEKYSIKVTSLKRMNGLRNDGVRAGMRLRVASK